MVEKGVREWLDESARLRTRAVTDGGRQVRGLARDASARPVRTFVVNADAEAAGVRPLARCVLLAI